MSCTCTRNCTSRPSACIYMFYIRTHLYIYKYLVGGDSDAGVAQRVLHHHLVDFLKLIQVLQQTPNDHGTRTYVKH